MIEVDCIGLSCPIPVVNVKKALKDNPDGLNVTVDNIAAKENVTRFASNQGYKVSSKEDCGVWKLEIRK